MNASRLGRAFCLLSAIAILGNTAIPEEPDRQGEPSRDLSRPLYAGTGEIIKKELQNATVDTKVITGKDLQVLDKLLPPLRKEAADNIREGDLYLLIRFTRNEPLYGAITYLEASIRPESWPFEGGEPFPGKFTFPNFFLSDRSNRPAYHLHHLMAPHVNSKEYRDAVIAAKWRLVVERVQIK